jgi:hypothetical protein
VMEIEPSPHVMDKEGLGEVDILAARPVWWRRCRRGQSRKGFWLGH